jgi:hypothetical protein
MDLPKKLPRALALNQKLRDHRKGEEELQVPEGYTIRTEAGRAMWNRLLKLRTSADWREFDLILLAKLVSFEEEIQDLTRELQTNGFQTYSTTGTLVRNPAFLMRKDLQMLQVQLLTKLRFNLTLSTHEMDEGGPRRKNMAHVLLAEELERQSECPDGLLAH